MCRSGRRGGGADISETSLAYSSNIVSKFSSQKRAALTTSIFWSFGRVFSQRPFSRMSPFSKISCVLRGLVMICSPFLWRTFLVGFTHGCGCWAGVSHAVSVPRLLQAFAGNFFLSLTGAAPAQKWQNFLCFQWDFQVFAERVFRITQDRLDLAFLPLVIKRFPGHSRITFPI